MYVKKEIDDKLKEIGKTMSDIELLYIVLYGNFNWNDGTYIIDIRYNNYNDISPYKLYDNGFGTQKLYGQIIFKDGTYLLRNEYDGSEWWDYFDFKLIRERTLQKRIINIGDC